MTTPPNRCLILACGNTLREDDGVGPWLADWAQEHFGNQPEIRVLSRHQWTPDLVEDIAAVQSVLFIDCTIDSAPGQVILAPVEPASAMPRMLTHHLNASDLLALSRDLYGSQPRHARLLSVGAASLHIHEGLSDVVTASLPKAISCIETTLQSWLQGC